MLYEETIRVAMTDAGKYLCLLPEMANRHGLIAGATGTGKTVTMKVMAEAFSDAGVPVFLCDVKGDVSGLAVPGADNSGMQKRIDKFGIRDCFSYKGYPVCFWDIYAKGGHPVRTTISEMGPEILSRILGLTEVQEGVLTIMFRIADDHGLKIIDMKDLRAVINFVNEHRAEYSVTYGNMAAQSIGAINRALIPLEDQGAELFFGCSSLREVKCPNGLTCIGPSMFSRCKALRSIVIPKGLQQIPPDAFSGCESIQEVVIPESVTKIGPSAFKGCRRLRRVKLPKTLAEIGMSAFEDCVLLEEAVFPKSLTRIESNAFRGCSSLEKLVLENPQTEIVRRAFKDCPKLKDSPDPEAVQQRKGRKMIEEQLKQEEEYIRKEQLFRLKTIFRLFM